MLPRGRPDRVHSPVNLLQANRDCHQLSKHFLPAGLGEQVNVMSLEETMCEIVSVLECVLEVLLGFLVKIEDPFGDGNRLPEGLRVVCRIQ